MEERKVLTVFGSPASGKTTTAIKIASELSKHKKNVILVNLDPYCPVIPYILPSTASQDISLGELLAKPSLSQTDILNACVSLENNEFITVIGYKLGESLSAYPKVIANNVVDFFIQLKHLADYVIIDCGTVIIGDVATIVAIQFADKVLRLSTSDLKGISYFYTTDILLADSKFDKSKQITALSNLKQGQEWESISAGYGGCEFVIPHTSELEQQLQEVRLFEPLTEEVSTPYNSEIQRFVGSVFSLTEATPQKKNKDKKPQNTGKKKKGFKLPFGKPKGEF